MEHLARLMLLIVILREAHTYPIGDTEKCNRQCTLNNSHIILPAAELCRCYGINIGSASIFNVTRQIRVEYSSINNECYFTIKMEDLCAFFGEHSKAPTKKRASYDEPIPIFPGSVQSQALTWESQADPNNNTSVDTSPAAPYSRSSRASSTQRVVYDDDVTGTELPDAHLPDTPTEDFTMKPVLTTTPRPVSNRTEYIPVSRYNIPSYIVYD